MTFAMGWPRRWVGAAVAAAAAAAIGEEEEG